MRDLGEMPDDELQQCKQLEIGVEEAIAPATVPEYFEAFGMRSEERSTQIEQGSIMMPAS